MPEDPRLSDTNPHDLDRTQQYDPSVLSRRQPPTPTHTHAQPAQEVRERSARDRRKRKPKPPKTRQNSGLYLPVWSVALMLLLVLGIAAGIIVLLFGLGGQPAPEGEPRIIIVTAIPSETPEFGGTTPAAIETGVVPVNPQGGSFPVPTFALEGPTLPPIILSPTPLSITLGGTVEVTTDGLNIRSGPGTENQVQFNANRGQLFTVIGGPQQGSSLTWWQVEDPADSSRTGWAAADYLEVVAQP